MSKIKNEHKEQKAKESGVDILSNLAQTYVRFPAEIFGDGDMFIATASEDYLHNYDIHKGDIIVFNRQDHADYGQIVCALVGTELFMRHYVIDAENGMPCLRSSNPEIQPAYDFTILGTVAWVLRCFENTGNGEVIAS